MSLLVDGNTTTHITHDYMVVLKNRSIGIDYIDIVISQNEETTELINFANLARGEKSLGKPSSAKSDVFLHIV